MLGPIGLFGSRERSSERCDQFVARGTSGYTGSWGVLWAGGPASDEEVLGERRRCEGTQPK